MERIGQEGLQIKAAHWALRQPLCIQDGEGRMPRGWVKDLHDDVTIVLGCSILARREHSLPDRPAIEVVALSPLVLPVGLHHVLVWQPEAGIISHEVGEPRKIFRLCDDMLPWMCRWELTRAWVSLLVRHTTPSCEVDPRRHQQAGLIIGVAEPELVLELHAEFCAQGNKIHLQETMALNTMAEVEDMTRLGQVHSYWRRSTVPRDEDQAARKLPVESHLLPRKLFVQHDGLRGLQVHLDKRRLVHHIE